MIVFTVAGTPIPQPRQRQRAVITKGRAFATNYTQSDHPVHAWKQHVQIMARQAYQGDPLNGKPISLSVKFLLSRPKSKKLPQERSWHISVPDCDNLVKSLKDALKGIVFRDDCLVCREVISKEYHAADEEPGCVVMIEVIT